MHINKGEYKIIIPGKNNFKVMRLAVQKGAEHYISINFSDALKKQQNLNGLVVVQNVKKPHFIINGNELKVFSNAKLEGNISVSIFPGILNSDNYKLKKTFKEIFRFSL